MTTQSVKSSPQSQHGAPDRTRALWTALGQSSRGVLQPEVAEPAVYSRWMSMVTEVSFPLGMALLVARHTMLSPFSMSEGAMNSVLMMLSLLPSRRSVWGGKQGSGKHFPTREGLFPHPQDQQELLSQAASCNNSSSGWNLPKALGE